MLETGQLNIHSYKNPRARGVQQVTLFEHEELHAELVVLPPGGRVDLHIHEDRHELFDVVEGSGRILLAGRSVNGGPGKCVFVAAGVEHGLHNDGDAPWVLRITCQDRLRPRDAGLPLLRALRRRLGVG